MPKIKKNDMVTILTGDDKAKQGKVLRVVNNKKVLIEGINLVKKHVKANPNTGERGGIVEREAPIDISNVALVVSSANTSRPSKIGYKFLENGRKVRYFKHNGELVDVG